MTDERRKAAEATTPGEKVRSEPEKARAGKVTTVWLARTEDRLRAGTLRCVVCTSSLDLGVDFTPVDEVAHQRRPQ